MGDIRITKSLDQGVTVLRHIDIRQGWQGRGCLLKMPAYDGLKVEIGHDVADVGLAHKLAHVGDQ